MDYRIGYPLDPVIYVQPFKKFFFSGKDGLQGRDEERFAEAMGTGQEIVAAGFNQMVYVLGLIDVKVILTDRVAT